MATKLKDLASIEAIIREMSVREKAACITGDSSFSSRALEKYGIPKLLWLDGGTGFNVGQMFWELAFQDYRQQQAAAGTPIDEESFTGRMGGMETTLSDPSVLRRRPEIEKTFLGTDRELGCYPPGLFFGATWNPEVIEACGHTLGAEANARGVDVLLGTPNVNLHRDPRGGRLFEGYSEDPCLVSKLAPAFVRGIQAEGVIANVKHFAANNQETDRMGINEHISERALRELYLPGFEACVKAGCKTVMSAYNRINGVPCAQNRWLLHDVLRGEWGFDGCVVTDWSAAYDQVEAAAAGNDLVMPGPRQLAPIVEAVENGTLQEELLDECVRNFLKIVLQSPAFTGSRKASYDKQAGIAAAYAAAKEGITLLKNDGVLPLPPDAKIAFYGRRSRDLISSGAGSAAVITTLTTQLYDCAAAALGGDHVSFEEIRPDTTVVVATVSANGQEGADRPDMHMEPEDRKSLDRAIADARAHGLPLVVLLNVAAPVQIVDWEPQANAILSLFIPGMQGGQATVDILLGKVNPSGKLPLSFPKYERDTPSYGNFPGYNSEVWYGEGIYVGYRYYEKKQIAPMYPFGHGLSYTNFEISGLTVPAQVNCDEQDIQIRVTVKNTGDMAGAEVVQLYIHDPVSTLDKPCKELKAFQKVHLAPGEEKTITLTLTKRDFASYDCRLGQWATEPGAYELLVGCSSADIRQRATLELLCGNPYGIGPRTDIVKVVSHPAALACVEERIGVKLQSVAGSYIVFQPLTTFEDVWRLCIVPKLKLDETRAAALLAEIYEAWQQL